MATSYTYSITTDFGGNINISNLHAEVVAETGITSATFTHIETVGDVVYVWFTGPISAGEQTLLNTIVTNHNSTTPTTYDQIIQMTPLYQSISTDTYTTVASCIFPGSIASHTIKCIKGVFKMDVGITSYSVRCEDITNNLTIAQVTGLTNTAKQIINVDSITNIPTGEATLEIQAKKIGGDGAKYIYIDNVVIYL